MNTITKRCAALLLSTALLVPLLAPSSRAATSVNVSVNGTPVAFSSATGTPFLDQNGRTQVPLRVTMEAMGAAVGWDNSTRTATVSKGSVSIRIPIGTSFILVNGVKKSNDTTAQIVNGRTYLPIRIVAESLSATVHWDNSTKSVQITAKGTPKVWLLTKETTFSHITQFSSTTTYSYDSANRPVSEGYSYTYNNQNQLLTETWGDASQFVRTYQYNNWGLVSYQKTISKDPENSPGDVEIWYEYNSKGDRTKELLHYIGGEWQTTTFTYTYDKNGRITKEIVNESPDSSVITYTYNSLGQVIKRDVVWTEYAMSQKYVSHFGFIYAYDSNGNLSKESSYEADGSISVDTYYYYTQR